MTTTFMSSPRLLFTSESVTEGHPDKLCDQVSDAILDAILERDPFGRVAAEAATTTGLMVVMGEITTSAQIDFQDVVRSTILEAGYTDAEYGFDGNTCAVMVSVKRQSPDIAMGVNAALETRVGRESDEGDEIGAGDQGMMIGFACNETPELMPMPIAFAHRLTRRLAEVRKTGILPWVRTDGKSQVTVEYNHGIPKRVDTVVISTQHAPSVTNDEIRKQVIEQVIRPCLPEEMLQGTKFLVNPTGRFVIGGPMGDAGLTGRKIIVDTYGGMARHGGGAFSGKDPTKVDRSSAYAARYVAKNIVAAGLADRMEVQLAYAIGVAKPVSICCETFGTHHVPEPEIDRLVRECFDLRPAKILENLRLRRPIYRKTAAYGHFGRTDIDAPWEETDKADQLRELAGLGKSPVKVG
ncbi:MAG TPA: methionine adenosyltransferase [Chloroflexota bacterium]|nr:methionine adenosyltransferase [Chloroflexota bacterium]